MNEAKIKHIMGKYSCKGKSILITMSDSHNKARMTYRKKEFEECLSVYSFYESQGKSIDEIEELWIKTYSERRSKSRQYSLKPIRERKDNQNPETYGINYGSGSCGSNRNRIRIPSKKHKNRYKNFLKLFPHFKEK
jgi:hypothetical protein